ncbi:TraR/DksA C4-type zinc finger protein [Conexibacter stalactiti]|uniref:TraR/DksA C4-type zinc finger protein n=1 Tax=Conexibacter stalactiti TaxID=1940611 RepID=A0ABU4HLV9_9ACTN|nr:TraR/DksA C4-type zinc finger protein [Conexibacter stalactiti]MDW5594288.1 TraR/DksA C4-type zinc finger protein [Conexibacter stalactiti]MEC5034930.1 TraR/DksA C4-type zinc finger protein [Conexibacter stalactiti]
MDTAHARELLARERARVERELAGLIPPGGEKQELTHLDQHLADGGTELFERERDAGFVEQLREELAAIERAEQRLADGSYGRSVQSGEPIPDARLEAVPWAERTVAEQAAYERS